MSKKDPFVISCLAHTWIFDIDGTLVKHNGYKLDGHDTLLPGVKDFFDNLPQEDYILLVTSRTEEYRESTIRFLQENGIRYHHIIFNLPFGERIVINDRKPSGLEMSKAVNLDRDCFDVSFLMDPKL